MNFIRIITNVKTRMHSSRIHTGHSLAICQVRWRQLSAFNNFSQEGVCFSDYRSGGSLINLHELRDQDITIPEFKWGNC